MSNSRTNIPASKNIPTLPFIPQREYNIQHTVYQEAPARASIVLWNLIDFAHVNWVHRKLYKYCKVLSESGHVTLLEYGVRYFFFLRLPISFPVMMWHEYTPPYHVRHLSRSPWGGYTRVDVRLEEFEKDNKIHTRIIHAFYANIPNFLLPFKSLFQRYIELWSARVWGEDYALILRRQKVLDCGFRDHPLDVTVRSVEGF